MLLPPTILIRKSARHPKVIGHTRSRPRRSLPSQHLDLHPDKTPDTTIGRNSRRNAASPYNKWERRKIYKVDDYTRFCPSEGSSYLDTPPVSVPTGVKEGNLFVHKVDGQGEYQVWCWTTTDPETSPCQWVRVYQGHEREIDGETYALTINAEGQPHWILSSTLVRREKDARKKAKAAEPREEKKLARRYSSFSTLPSSSTSTSTY